MSIIIRCEISVLELLCQILDIEPSEEVENMVENLAEFFLCPKDSGRSVPPSPVKRRASGRSAKKSKTEESDEEEPKEGEGADEKPNGELNTDDDVMETSVSDRDS